MITLESTICKSKELLMSSIENEAIILGIKSGMYFGLNEMGSLIWNQLETPIKVSDLITMITEEYDETEGIIREHILEFLNTLDQKSLIVHFDEA